MKAAAAHCVPAVGLVLKKTWFHGPYFSRSCRSLAQGSDLGFSAEMLDYLDAVSVRDDALLQRMREETNQMQEAVMQVSAHEGQVLQFLVKLIGAKNALEIGVFTGYSALVTARALAEDGRLVACDVNEEYVSIAKKYWKEAGVRDKIDVRIGPALNTLNSLIDQGAEGTFDFVFIDANKRQYDAYYERSLALLRQGGLCCIDNMLWHGRVLSIQEQNNTAEAMTGKSRRKQKAAQKLTEAIDALNRKLHVSILLFGHLPCSSFCVCSYHRQTKEWMSACFLFVMECIWSGSAERASMDTQHAILLCLFGSRFSTCRIVLIEAQVNWV